ncbi:MAG: CopD family protein [Gemmatimonadota bacterium]|nr:CopD family protein [Gemmatimonadota bacterium]
MHSPQLIRLWFSERPDLSITAVSLKDANGREFTLAAPERDPADPLLVLVPVSLPLPPGRYTVAWRTAASDGHPSRGTFSFVVLGSAGLPAGPPPRATDRIGTSTVASASSMTGESGEVADAASSVSNSLARTLSFVGLLVLIGATTFRALVLHRARGISTQMRDQMEARAALLGLSASVLVLLGVFARLFLESQMMSAMPGMETMSMTEMAMHTQWGLALRLEIGAAVLALVSFALARRRLRGAWLAASISAIVLAVTPALAGHAAASPKFTSLMIATDFLHVLGGASWLGSLLAVMVVGIPLSLTLDGAERWSTVASLVNSFSQVALPSVAIVVGSGLLASWVHLEHLSSLWQTEYGQVLLLKLLLVAVTLTIGAYNFRRVQPQLVNEVGAVRLRLSAAIELGFGFLILLVTGFLTGISP